MCICVCKGYSKANCTKTTHSASGFFFGTLDTYTHTHPRLTLTVVAVMMSDSKKRRTNVDPHKPLQCLTFLHAGVAMRVVLGPDNWCGADASESESLPR